MAVGLPSAFSASALLLVFGCGVFVLLAFFAERLRRLVDWLEVDEDDEDDESDEDDEDDDDVATRSSLALSRCCLSVALRTARFFGRSLAALLAAT